MQFSLFRDASFSNDCVVINAGCATFNHARDMGFANDSVSSLKVGAGFILKVCENADLGGRCQDFGNGNIVDHLTGSGGQVHNDSISSVQMWSCWM